MTTPSFTRHLRPDRAVLRLSGDGVLAFLNNLLTADLTQLRPLEGAYGALLSPQGKILHDLFVIHHGDAVFIDSAAAQADDLLQKLKLYRLRARIEMTRADDLAVAVSPTANLGTLGYADPRLPAMGYRGIVERGSMELGDGYDDVRLHHGLGDSVADIGSGKLFAHEANLDQLKGVSFSKGCYVGQEIVSRMHHRSTARTRLLPVRFAGNVAAGADVETGGARLGEMLSSNKGHGLALLRIDKLAEAQTAILSDGIQLHIQKPAWAKYELEIPEVAQ